MSIVEPSKISVPFADSGLKNSIPQTANNTTGKAGFDKGFPERTMLPKASGGIPPSGMDFNGILFDVTAAIRYMQAGGKPTYDSSFASAIGGYPLGAVLIGDDGVSVFQNAVAGNQADPNSGGDGWARPDLQVMELYRRSYAEAGYNVVGTFQGGFTLVNANDVGIDLATGKGYTGPAGAVAAGTNPTSWGFVDVSSALLRSALLQNTMTIRNEKLALKYYIHASDYGVIDDYYLITPTVLATLIGGVTGYSYAIAINPNPTDNADKIQKALNELAPGGVLDFSGMRGIGISRTMLVMTERVSVVSDNKDISQIFPVSGFSGTCLFRFGDGTQAYQKTKGIGYIAAINGAGDDVSGIESHNFYNFEATDIKAQSGNYRTRECAGIDIIDGRHTLIDGSNLHNSFCYGMIIRKHLTGLKIYGNAFDESDCAIISKGNIVELTTLGNEFGSSRPNPTYPAPVNGVTIDLRVGVHGSVSINDLFSGGGGTKYHIRWNYINSMNIDGIYNTASRFAIAGNEGTSRIVAIKGTFRGNGSARTTTDPSLGTSDPDTSPFCCDVHLAKAYLYPTNIAVNSDSTVPSAWVAGGENNLQTSNVTMSDTSNSGTSVGYVHSKLIEKGADLQRGLLNYKTIGAISVSVPGATITNGTPLTGVASVAGATVGDTVAVSFKDSTMNGNLVASGKVQSGGIVRWVIVNTSGTPVTIAATELSVSILKTK